MAGKRDILFIVLAAIALFVITSVIAPWLLDLRSANEPYRPPPGIKLAPLRKVAAREQSRNAEITLEPQEDQPNPGIMLRVVDHKSGAAIQALVQVQMPYNRDPTSGDWFSLDCSGTCGPYGRFATPLPRNVVLRFRIRATGHATHTSAPFKLTDQIFKDFGDIRLERLVNLTIKLKGRESCMEQRELILRRDKPDTTLDGLRLRSQAVQGKYYFTVVPGHWRLCVEDLPELRNRAEQVDSGRPPDPKPADLPSDPIPSRVNPPCVKPGQTTGQRSIVSPKDPLKKDAVDRPVGTVHLKMPSGGTTGTSSNSRPAPVAPLHYVDQKPCVPPVTAFSPAVIEVGEKDLVVEVQAR